MEAGNDGTTDRGPGATDFRDGPTTSGQGSGGPSSALRKKPCRMLRAHRHPRVPTQPRPRRAMRFCTVLARNYLAYARVLGQSLRDVDADLHLSVLVLDDDDGAVDDTDEPFDVLRPGDLDISPREFHHMAVIYDVLELATAVKPWLLHRVLADDDVACYLDPDIEVFGSMDPVEALAKRNSIVLTPHSTTPFPRDGLIPSEKTIRLAGVFNLGFIAVSRDAGSFLSWWSERL